MPGEVSFLNRKIKSVVFWVFIGISALLLFQVVRSDPAKDREPEISYSRFVSEAEAGHVSSVTITGTRIRGQYSDGKGTFRLTGPNNPGVFLDILRAKGVDIWFRETSGDSLPLQLLGTWAPLILLGALWFFMIRQMQRKAAIGRGETPGSSGSSLG
jgi:cell division protease FtsH